MRRTFSDLLLSAGAVAILLAILVASDARVRQELTERAGTTARATHELVSVGNQARSVTELLVQSVKDQVESHQMLMMFVFAASILTAFMIRT